MLEWYVIYGDFNKGTIERYNVFDHGGFFEDCQKNKNKNAEKIEFINQLQKDLKYHFWSKCEWEVIVSHWPPVKRFQDEKIDVYDQIIMNWIVFSDYVWDHRNEFDEQSIRCPICGEEKDITDIDSW
jgi:hypothetical protein